LYAPFYCESCAKEFDHLLILQRELQAGFEWNIKVARANCPDCKAELLGDDSNNLHAILGILYGEAFRAMEIEICGTGLVRSPCPQ